jgi:hypothetical protein
MREVQANDPRLIEITELANHVLRAVNDFKPSSRRLCADALALIIGEIVQSDDGFTPEQAVAVVRKACNLPKRIMN